MMDQELCFARTEKGREELLGSNRALKPKPRQVLFLIGEAITVQQLKQKLPACQELESILEQLWQGGYIGQMSPHLATKSVTSEAAAEVGGAQPAAAASDDIAPARARALAIISSLVGERSPVFAKVSGSHDRTTLLDAVAAAKKVIAAAASSSHAQAFETEVQGLLNAA